MTHPIPDEALNTHIGVLGKTGAGKSYTARGLVERLLHLRRHVVIVDPTGAWWGLRTGFEVPIFGGRKGDVEISDAAGAAVAAVIAEQRASAILDLSLMSGGGQRRFMRDFAHRLRAKEPGALYLVIDEADEFLPQQLQPDMMQMFGDLKWMVRRGRLNGFRVMMVTQRPAEIAKAVLTQIETLVAHRLTAPQDRKAIEEWVKGHHDPSEAREVLSTLASLGKGEAWVWCPDINLLERAMMPLIETFDSGRTPDPGQSAVEPPALADLDLSAIRDAMSVQGAASPARADDSGQVRELQAELAFRGKQIERLEIEAAGYRSALEEISRISAIAGQGGSCHVDRSAARAPVEPEPRSQAAGRESPQKAHRGSPSGAEAAANPTAAAIADLLDRINPARVTWAQAAAMVGRKPTGGNFNAARKWLRGSGRIVEEGDFIRSAADAPRGMTREQARELWHRVLTKPAPAMLTAFFQSRLPLSKEHLGDALGIASRGGFFNGGFSQLRNNGLIVGEGDRWSIARPLPGEAS